MSKLLRFLIQLIAAMVNVVVGYLINQISSTETLSSKGLSQTDVLIFGLIGAAIVALASINMLTSDSSSTASQSQSATQTVALASGIPVLLSVTLYAGLKSGFLPLEYSQEIFYVALVLFVVGAILPSILIHPRGIVQAISRNTVFPTSQPTPDDWRRELLQVMTAEVNKRLEDSLHNDQFIPLGMKDQRELVGRPTKKTINSRPAFWERWLQPNRSLKIGTGGKTLLNLDNKIIDVFNRDDIAGRLLILGAPGSGKTTTLLELAKYLIERTQKQPNQQIPVIFELSNWKDDKQSIVDWLVADLKERYTIPEAISRNWITRDQLLPLLDGLDELGLTRQVKCIEKINEFLRSIPGQSLIVCCRQEEYSQGARILDQLRGAVSLQPLTEMQIEYYLKQLGCSHLWKPIKDNPEGLLELAKIPLFLSIIPWAYPNGLIRAKKQFNTLQELKEYHAKCRQELFDTYLEHRLDKPSPQSRYTKQETKHWLSWLANKLRDEKQTEFFIEKMQPSWLKNNIQKWIYRIGVGLGSGLINFLFVFIMSCIVFGVYDGWISGLVHGLILSLFFGLLAGIIGFVWSFNRKIKMVKSLEFPWRKILSWASYYFLTTMGLTFLEIFSVKDAVFGSIFAVIIIVFFSLGSSSEKTASRYPNQGFIETAKHSVIFYLSATPIFMAFLYLSQRLISEKAVEIEVVVILGLIFALLVGYFCAGLACIQHIVLRLILWWSGAIPRNYQHFFSYGRELGFIQQVGGRYRFIHDLLREHFYENY
ncbi:MAG: NACHT domain-containing protein [Coleofasciculus chthonoplastes F1-TOW-03]